MFVCLPLRLLLTNGMHYDKLNRLYDFYIAPVVDIISRCGLRIKACHRNQLN